MSVLGKIMRSLREGASLTLQEVGIRYVDSRSITGSIRVEYADEAADEWSELEGGAPLREGPHSLLDLPTIVAVLQVTQAQADALYEAARRLPPDVVASANNAARWPLIRVVDAIAGRATVEIDYTNHRGEREVRRVQPRTLTFGVTPHHSTPQWIVDSFCLARNSMRSFALGGVHAWRVVREDA